MTEYHLLTTWRIEAPLEQVYAAIHDVPDWPTWWPAAKRLEAVSAGDADGVGSVWRHCWQGYLPYRLAFDVRTTRIDPLLTIEGITRGDLDGVGRWHFSSQGGSSIVRYEWHVRSRRWWMNLSAPLLRPIFIRNHAQVMKQGGTGLAGQLGARLLGLDTIDLTDGTPVSGQLPSPAAALIAGLAAGIVATFAQLLLWWLTGVPLAETFLRDAHLTAAILLGEGILHAPFVFRWDVLLAATLIHFALSIAYAILPAWLAGPWGSGKVLGLGALYGLIIYGINLHGFTLLYPWFAMTRGWSTLIVHLIFGVVLVGSQAGLIRMRTTPPSSSPIARKR